MRDVVIRGLKRGVLRTCQELGAFDRTRDSDWRSDRLVILCYHGVSLDDEHEWNGAFYMSPALFERRLQALRDGGYNVLPFAEAIDRLYAGTLPPRSVCLTFDDGMVDFKERVFPLLERYALPATVYLTTFYCDYAAPVFDPFVQYLMWKSGARVVDLHAITGEAERMEIGSLAGRHRMLRRLRTHADAQGMSAQDKTALAERLARALGVDFDALMRRRLLHLMTPAEVTALGQRGIDFQLHTHRHRTPRDRALFLHEIEENRDRLRAMVGGEATHFCYPSGVHRPEFLPWLREAGVTTATTTHVDLASPSSPALLLPRVVDTSSMGEVEFAGWLTGVAARLPRRAPAVY
jgi:peptidoglycan/xylan/chitin deacetylase (PgdA/CDA1 family)